MTSIEERMKILKMIEEGKISAEEGAKLLAALREARRGPGSIPLHGLDVLLSSAEGDIYTTTEYRGMLEAAGFFQVEAVKDEPALMQARRQAPPAPTVPESNSSTPNV